MKTNLIILFISLFIVYNSESQQHIDRQTLQESHINANVPDHSDFDRLITRDLEKYFAKSYGKISVKWEYLREGATQSGVAYPKYYLWVKIYQGKKEMNLGAVRLAAIDKTKFDVTDFISVKKIKSNPKGIYEIFPALVCETIKTKI